MRSAIVAFSLLVACNPDGGLKVVNSPPNAAITSPPTGTVVDEYSTVTFEAHLNDDFDDESKLGVGWSSDIDGEFSGPFPIEGGVNIFETANLTPGNHTITVMVVDTKGDTAQDSIQLTVEDRPEAPAVSIVHPTGSDEIIEGELFEFVIQVVDAQDPPESLILTFESDLDGVLCQPTADAIGVATCEAMLTADDHLLSFHAEDPSGELGTATVYWGVTSREDIDDDGDGFTETQGDCDDTDGSVYPGAEEFYNDRDDDCDDIVDEGTQGYDDDGDGYSEIDGDCDDDAATTYPGAPEICDSYDNDCDTTVDEGTNCYDDDGDGWTELHGDCDDTSATTYPGAVELADGDDNDCDGTVDEETVNYDDDGDGYSEIAGDCDDTDATVSPAGTEACGDGVDNDCDGSVDEAAATGCTDYYYDYDGDGYGSTTSMCLCTSGGYYTSRYNTDCYDSNANANPGATSWQTTDRGDGSHDWNCDGSQSKRYTGTGGCGGWPTCNVSNGWNGSVAACGTSANWVSSCSTEVLFSCSKNYTSRSQNCR
jgi:hypothetical protein